MDTRRMSRVARPWEEAGSARTLAAFAEGLGLDVLVRVTPAEYVLQGTRDLVRLAPIVGVHGRSRDLGVAFRALWVDGKTAGASVAAKAERWSVDDAGRAVYVCGPYPRALGVLALRALLPSLVADSGPEEKGP